ncbi:MAG: cell envelope integrity protein TolA [Pseudomonadota bacterium]
MSAKDQRPPEGGALPVKRLHLGLAVLGHVLMGAVLIFGAQCSPKPPKEIVIQAVLLEAPVEGEKPVTVEEAVKPKPPEPTPPPPEPEPPKPKPPEPPPPKPEPPKVDPAKLKQEAEAAEQKRVEEITKREEQQLLAKQQAEEKVRQAEEKARVDAEAKAKRDAEELVRKTAEEQARKAALDAEQKRLAEIEDAKRKAAEAAENKRKAEERARAEALAAQLAAEENARMAAIRADSQALWVRAMGAAIRRNWLRPPDNQATFACKVGFRLINNGQVVPNSVRIVSSCGSLVLDDSVIKAVYKASPLPLPSEPSAFVADLVVNFRP